MADPVENVLFGQIFPTDENIQLDVGGPIFVLKIMQNFIGRSKRGGVPMCLLTTQKFLNFMQFFFWKFPPTGNRGSAPGFE